RHSLLDGVTHIDSEILNTIRGLVSGFEVENRTSHDWKMAILKGYEIFRCLVEDRCGVVEVDLCKRQITYKSGKE
ncbi:MAG: nucleotide pyrophosphohydrolase, partial [Gammaproteobacteria bacterium]|nr:nucleotide pyrophosphohydrolase [Gammaproteobacteria bacterium]